MQVGDGTKAANESSISPIMNFTMASPFGNASDYPFRYGMTADVGQTLYSYQTVTGLMVSKTDCTCECHSLLLGEKLLPIMGISGLMLRNVQIST